MPTAPRASPSAALPISGAPAHAAHAEPEEVPLKAVACTAPALNIKLLDLMGDRRINVPVRSQEEADVSVSAAQALGCGAPAATGALCAAVGRGGDVEFAFQAGG